MSIQNQEFAYKFADALNTKQIDKFNTFVAIG